MSVTNWTSNFDIYDGEQAQNLHRLFDEARGHCPVVWSNAHGGYWLVSGATESRTILQDDRTFTSERGKNIPERQPIRMPPMDVDGAEHQAFRRVLNRFFSKSAILQHEALFRDVAMSIVRDLRDKRQMEVISEFASPFTIKTLASVILNLDLDDVQRAQQPVEMIGGENSPAGWTLLRTLVAEILGARRSASNSDDDMLGAIVSGTVQGRPITEEEQEGILMILLLGGLDTTKAAISNIAYRVASRPGLEARIRDPEWIRQEMDEFLRYDSPVTGLARWVTEDVEVAGQRMQAGDPVMVCYGAANRDAREFSEPSRLDLHRSQNRHLAFGVGIHRCIGAHFARLQIALAFEALLSSFTNFRLVDEQPPMWAAGSARHLTELHVQFDRA
jgi:cytochrome P450